MRRIKKLEDAQKATVDSSLEEIRHFLKSAVFTKDKVLDLLLNLKLVAKETKHPRSGFFEAVLGTTRDRTTVPVEQFKRYLEVLLGDKDQEKVLETIAKVDKAARVSSSSKVARSGNFTRNIRDRANRTSVQCFFCHQFCHFQAYCPARGNQGGSGPSSKRCKSSSGQYQNK